jgi:hypothetical protein
MGTWGLHSKTGNTSNNASLHTFLSDIYLIPFLSPDLTSSNSTSYSPGGFTRFVRLSEQTAIQTVYCAVGAESSSKTNVNLGISPVSIIPPMLHTHLHLQHSLAPPTSKQWSFTNRRALDAYKSTFTYWIFIESTGSEDSKQQTPSIKLMCVERKQTVPTPASSRPVNATLFWRQRTSCSWCRGLDVF